jgi:hypothetical protein
LHHVKASKETDQHHHEHSVRAGHTTANPCISYGYLVGALHVYMSNSPSASWINLIKKKKRLFLQQGCKVICGIGNEDALRTAFEKLCRQNRVKYTPRLLVKLSPSFENIITFAEAVVESVTHLPSDELKALVWGVSFAAIMVIKSTSRKSRSCC